MAVETEEHRSAETGAVGRMAVDEAAQEDNGPEAAAADNILLVEVEDTGHEVAGIVHRVAAGEDNAHSLAAAAAGRMAAVVRIRRSRTCWVGEMLTSNGLVRGYPICRPRRFDPDTRPDVRD